MGYADAGEVIATVTPKGEKRDDNANLKNNPTDEGDNDDDDERRPSDQVLEQGEDRGKNSQSAVGVDDVKMSTTKMTEISQAQSYFLQNPDISQDTEASKRQNEKTTRSSSRDRRENVVSSDGGTSPLGMPIPMYTSLTYID